jgi:arylsulfatase A-like enzyme
LLKLKLPTAALLLLGASQLIQAAQPNIVLILADDLGFTDSAPYGGEISTPALSELADNGIKFTNYHTAASCAPSRAMLLTGVDSHRNGVPHIAESILPEHKVHDNYQGVLGNNVVTIATLLQDAGYHTYMTGKWHLGKEPQQLPFNRGFERTVSMADTGADNWEQKPYLPIYDKANWTADGKEFQLPEDFYSSKFLVDKTIEFIDSNRDDGKPFFAYVPFQAVHIPVQAPKEFTDKYLDTYKDGWTALREQRQARAIELGLIPADAAMVTMDTTGDWEALSDAQKRYNAKRMAVYAGMVDAMDHHIARLIKHLKAIKQYDNTIFIFTSDNGAEYGGNDIANTAVARFAMKQLDYTLDYDNLGEKGSFNSIGVSFGSAASSPFAFYKFYAGEGGMRVPLIIAGEAIKPQQTKTNAFAYVTDIAPTILELAGAPSPTYRYGGKPIDSISGRSLIPLLNGESEKVYGDEDYIGYELGGNRALFQGDYKIVFNRGPVGDSRWHLFNIVKDPGETNDLSADMPARLQTMLGHYEQYSRDNNVLPVPKEYDSVKQAMTNGIRARIRPTLLLMFLTAFSLMGVYAVYRQRSNHQ